MSSKIFLIRQDLLIKRTWKIKKSILGLLTAEEDLTKYLQTNVDGIITDDPALADQIKEEKKRKTETYFDRSIKFCLNNINKDL